MINLLTPQDIEAIAKKTCDVIFLKLIEKGLPAAQAIELLEPLEDKLRDFLEQELLDGGTVDEGKP